MARTKSIFAGTFGNALEWYDFTVYAFFAPVLASVFFPIKNSFISMVMTLSVFAASFLVRPLGAIFFGYCGDHFGRKKALIISIALMSCPTLLLAFLPSYASIGVTAPLVALTLVKVTGDLISPAWYMIACAIISLLTLIGLEESYQKKL